MVDHRQEDSAIGSSHTFLLGDHLHQVQLARMGDLGPLQSPSAAWGCNPLCDAWEELPPDM